MPEPQQKPPNPQTAPSMPSSQAVSQAVDQSPQTSPASAEDIFAALERLAELHKKGVLTDEEFAAKKAELLARI